MDLIPFRRLLETAAADPAIKNFTGDVVDPSRLFERSTWDALLRAHRGPFAFIAFHPVFDPNITDYLASGSLNLDSGSAVMVLTILDVGVHEIEKVPVVPVPGVRMSTDEHPSYTLLRTLFKDRRAPSLPGVTFFDGFPDDAPAIYVSLQGLDETALRARLRELFEHAAQAYRADAHNFDDRLGASLELQKIRYMKSERLSLREWLAKSWNFIRESKAEIMSHLIGFATHKESGGEKK